MVIRESLPKYHRHLIWISILATLLLVCLVGLYLVLNLIHAKMTAGFGVDAADVATSFTAVVMLSLGSFSLIVSALADLTLYKFSDGKRKSIWSWVLKKPDHSIQQITSNPETESNLQPETNELIFSQEEIELIFAQIDQPRKRGRPPNYPLKRWARVVLVWENRDRLHCTMTLLQLLGEEFGYYNDGTPRASESSYREWRDKVFEYVKTLRDQGSLGDHNPSIRALLKK